ncbi:zeta toxin family protein [Nocardia sp. NPDC004260]
MRFEGLSRRELCAAFDDALASALEGRDLVLDAGFGPDAEKGLIDVAFARGDVGQDSIAKLRDAFVRELALQPTSVSPYSEVVRPVLTRMAHCSLMQWHGAHADPPDAGVVHDHRLQRRTWLAWLFARDSGHFDLSALHSTLTSRASELGPPDVLDAGTLAAIFDHDILPETFPPIRPQNQPSALLLCRSSSTYPLPALRLAFERGCVAVDPDVLTAYHPRAALSVDAGVLHDTLLWTVMAIRYAVERRGDVVVQTAADMPQQINDLAELFANSGYRVVLRRGDDESFVWPVELGDDG